MNENSSAAADGAFLSFLLCGWPLLLLLSETELAFPHNRTWPRSCLLTAGGIQRPVFPSDVAGVGEESHEKTAASPAVSAGIALKGREEMLLCFGEQAPLRADQKQQPLGVSISLVSSGVTVLAACCVPG